VFISDSKGKSKAKPDNQRTFNELEIDPSSRLARRVQKVGIFGRVENSPGLDFRTNPSLTAPCRLEPSVLFTLADAKNQDGHL